MQPIAGPIRLGIPKGSLQHSTLELFAKAGLHFSGSDRDLWLKSNDPELVPVLLKPQEIPLFVSTGRLDCGLTGRDWIAESRIPDDAGGLVKTLLTLPFARRTNNPVRWVLAVPDSEGSIRDLDSLRTKCHQRRAEGRPFVIATELTHISKSFLARLGIDAVIEFSWGASEAKAGYFADAIIESTETGSSLRANNLVEIVEVFRSRTQFIANTALYRENEWKRTKIDGIVALLQGAFRATTLAQVSLVSKDRRRIVAALEEFEDDVPPIGVYTADEEHMVMAFVDRTRVQRLLARAIREGVERAWVSDISLLHDAATSTDHRLRSLDL